ncbi:DUF1127 domain-containing protein [Sedimentitalea todarodis]|uniref:DUF1127 domain-containing protein n=1 Tax=Sedimentitalea todarodis TaxID=1631240 RepID=A0ABU3VED8_9RHOB|nr:DUF1127 domain-containing protein [Sedimentitalea todarodis]MDU9004551.1 DUF1127 domain-containing protein [Sedimentitalea todarodis]
MSHYTADHQAFAPTGNPISRFFSAIGNALVSMSTSNARVRQVEALQRLSDEELKERNLKRSDIVRHVFQDAFWT